MHLIYIYKWDLCELEIKLQAHVNHICETPVIDIIIYPCMSVSQKEKKYKGNGESEVQATLLFYDLNWDSIYLG